jgi:pilus assembly protein CpaE
MAEISVMVLSADDEQRTILQMQVDGTAVAKTIQTFSSMPAAATDLTIRRIQDAMPDVVLVDIPRQAAAAAIYAIELLRTEVPKAAVFAVGDTKQPQVIIAAMRAGAREYLEHPTSTNALLEALVRATASNRRVGTTGERGRVFLFMNAKGGDGATTLAVNTALAIQMKYGSTAIVDMAPLGHAAIHLNARSQFTIQDALRSAARLDHTLLDNYMTNAHADLRVLAGVNEPGLDDISNTDLARVFDMLIARHKFVIVDASSRLDRLTRVLADLSETILLVGQADVVSLWSAAKVQAYVGESAGRGRLRLILNRYRKIPGLSDSDIEAATHSQILAKVPNQYHAISSGIDRGTPLMQQNSTSEIAKSFHQIASALTQAGNTSRRKGWPLSLFGVESDARA